MHAAQLAGTPFLSLRCATANSAVARRACPICLIVWPPVHSASWYREMVVHGSAAHNWDPGSGVSSVGSGYSRLSAARKGSIASLRVSLAGGCKKSVACTPIAQLTWHVVDCFRIEEARLLGRGIAPHAPSRSGGTHRGTPNLDRCGYALAERTFT